MVDEAGPLAQAPGFIFSTRDFGLVTTRLWAGPPQTVASSTAVLIAFRCCGPVTTFRASTFTA